MNFDKLVESMIKEAQKRGEFDNLPGKGKSIDLTAYFETPEEVRVAIRFEERQHNITGTRFAQGDRGVETSRSGRLQTRKRKGKFRKRSRKSSSNLV